MGKSDKSLAKKLEKRAMERKMAAGNANVKLANSKDDPLSELPSFNKYSKNGLDLKLETIRGPEMDEKTMEWAFRLLEANMKPLYDKCYANNDPEFRWNEARKREEMGDAQAWYLLARTEEGTPVAFSHFRYDMDFDDDVIYCYEINVEKGYRRKGLGRYMMKILELLMMKADMIKLMATIFKNDPIELKFFKDCLKFKTDETSPEDDAYDKALEYEILCRFNLKKLRDIGDKENAVAIR